MKHMTCLKDIIHGTLLEMSKGGKPKITQLNDIGDWTEINPERLLHATDIRTEHRRIVTSEANHQRNRMAKGKASHTWSAKLLPCRS